MMLDPTQLQQQHLYYTNSAQETGCQAALASTVIARVVIDNTEPGPKISIDRLQTPDRGRIMVAASFIPEGALIGAIPPQAITCDTAHRTKRCGKCLGPTSCNNENGNRGGPGTIACEGCCEIWYCDERCRVQDWDAVHKYECKFLKRLYNGNGQEEEGSQRQSNDDDERYIEKFREMGDYERDYCRLMIRILIHRFKEHLLPQFEDSSRPREQEPDDGEPLPFSCVLDLVENRSGFSKELIEGNFLNVARIMDAFQTVLEQNSCEMQKPNRSQLDGSLKGVGEVEVGGGIPRLSLDELVGLVLREECNSFGLYEYGPTIEAAPTGTSSTSNSRIGYGLGLYIRNFLHSFNHSCTPNLYHVASKDRQLVYAARDISQGEELNIKYMEFTPEYRIPNAEQRRQEKERSLVKELDRKIAFEKRRAFLKEIFHFDCACQRCRWELSMNWGSSQPETSREEEEEEKFLREGLVCERDGCYGFYAPPVVLELMRRNTTSYVEKQQQLQGEEAEVGQWECVACGRQRG
ncbi:hypothetical protein BGZ80_001200 [Entomortierella chlamydospora]|uniref:Suppressor of anucleate metulae protein B n=1 Tax=Entomortierella chlamydospora TaxID=101097 RepID=A0A9P6N1V3_9FUNG|nr:hypothetical protein BGZ79_006856 [Entomortierella chlamydospora]KAG0022033.1 hypothetical protein BGZ80_001200 [Entomortierella chlamydospora]